MENEIKKKLEKIYMAGEEINSSLIQRRFLIGYAKAAGFVDLLKEKEIVKDLKIVDKDAFISEGINYFQTLQERQKLKEKKAFDKIIGYEAIKNELKRVCDTLVNTEKYEKFSVKFSQGLLLHGEPGVGKTLMAECLIEESKRKVFICRKDESNGVFVEKIKHTFQKAQENEPSIVFLDDMDKFANEDEFHRDAEEYVTIQSCIDEIKGKDIFVLATANELRDIPKSLLRTGRFSKIIKVENPVGEDCEKIMNFYLSQKKNVGKFDIREIARVLNGKSCSDLEIIINEAGIYAAYDNKENIEKEHIVRACMRVLFESPETDEIAFTKNKEELKRVAYHEAGHAVIAELLEPENVTLVSIATHTGSIGGITSHYQDASYWASMKSMENRVLSVLGGKAATEIVFGEIDTGANSDLQRAFRLVQRFIDDYCAYGFDKFIFGRENSNEKINRFDLAVAGELEKYYSHAKSLLIKNREFLDKLADELIKKSTLLSSDIQAVKKSCKIVY